MSRRNNDARARDALVWTVAAFVAAQVGLTLALEFRRHDVNDPEFEIRSALLEDARQAEPDRPLLLVMGSSRFVTNVRPEWMPPLTATAGPAPLVFNFSHFGSGPVMNLVQMNRVLHDFRPRWVVLEVLPPFLPGEGSSFLTTILGTRDLQHLHSYLNPGKLYGRWLQKRVLPCCRNRAALCDLIHPGLFFDESPAMRFDRLGGFVEEHPDAEPTATQRAERMPISRGQYFELAQRFCISAEADAALRQSIVAAREAGVQVVLMISPESSEFRSWYAPGAEAQLNDFSRNLAATYGVSVVNARSWVPDREFTDGHHLFGAAARRYTEQFTRQVLQPLVDGRLEGVVRLAAPSDRPTER